MSVRRAAGALAALGVLMGVAACAPQEPDYAAGHAVPADFPQAQAYAQELFELTNELRDERGLAQLEWAPCAQEIAQRRLGEIIESGTFAHPDSSTMCADATVSGENLAHGTFLPAQLMGEWEASSGHLTNLISPDYRRVGIACVATGIEEPLEPAGDGAVGGILCSQVFAG